MPLAQRAFSSHAVRAALAAWLAVVGVAAHALASETAPRPIAPPASAALSVPSAADDPADIESSRAHRPIAQPNGSVVYDATRTAVALFAVLALALVLKKLVKRIGDPLAARRPSGVVQVLSRFPLAKGQQVILLEVGRRVLCVHQSSNSAVTLCAFDDLTEIADLKARIEAGSSDRATFDRELTRSIERSPVAPMGPAATETIDLTKRRTRSLLGSVGRGVDRGAPADFGGRA